MQIRVELRKGGLEAAAFLDEGPFEPAEALRSVIEQLHRAGVSAVDPEQVGTRLAGLNNGSPREQGVVVACGQAPQQGVSAQVRHLVPLPETPLAEGVDPLQAYVQNVVYPDQLILKKTPPSPGIPGKSLLGVPLAAPDGKDIPVSAGSGVEVDEACTDFLARAYGVALFHRGRLEVCDCLKIAEDRMEARLTVLPDPRLDPAAHTAKLLEALTRLGVTDGVDRAALEQAVATARETAASVRDVVVARGSAPVDGREVDYKLLIDPEKKVGKILESGRIDFREAETVKNVSRREVLADIIPAIEPVPGRRVDGTQLRPKLQRATGLKPGENTVPSEDGTQVLADADGMLVIQGGRFHVADDYLVQGDVDYRTGNIRASGSIHIRGQVKAGFRVETSKSVEIGSDVEDAAVDAGEDLTVRGGITANSQATAGRNLTVKYLQNSHVEAGGDVDVKLSVTNSKIYAKGKVTALGSPGAILGGEINAARGIEARTVGSPSSTTHVAVGVDLRVVRDIEEIDKKIAHNVDELKKVQSFLGQSFLKDPRTALAAIPASMRKQKIDMLHKMKEFYQQVTDLKAQRDMLALETQDLRNAQIVVQGEIHAGTDVTVSSARLKLPETLRHCVLYFDADRGQVAWRRI